VVSFDKLVPNYKNECIIFTNTSGYQRINDAFRSSEVESYLVGKFNSDEKNQKQILDNINHDEKLRSEMMYPTTMDIAYMKDDTSNVLSPAAIRIAFVPQLIDKLNIANIALSIFLMVLALLICIFVINNYISSKRVEIGIMRANGVRRRKIVFSLIPFAMIPAIIGGVIGYIVGFLLADPTVQLFHNY
jgi:putative ABC transport system permease protein